MSKRARELRGLKQWLGLSRKATVSKPASIPEEKPESRFEVGHKYTIITLEGKPKYQELISPTTGVNCVFRYEGKHGIHHFFREERGGWTRTYTDVQLIGKRITEV